MQCTERIQKKVTISWRGAGLDGGSNSCNDSIAAQGNAVGEKVTINWRCP